MQSVRYYISVTLLVLPTSKQLVERSAKLDRLEKSSNLVDGDTVLEHFLSWFDSS